MTRPDDRRDIPAPGEWIAGAVAWLVPDARRADWLEDWQAEIRYAWARGTPRLTLVARACGALPDAIVVRRTHGGDLMLARDVRFAARRLARRPGFSLLVALTLALGIGATTAVFTIVDGVLLRPLPFANAERLVALGARREPTGFASPYLSPAALDDWRSQDRVVERIARHRSRSVVLEAGEPRQLRAEAVSADFFPLLGVAPRLGRTFAPEESEAGAQVAVLSDALWREAFGGDPGIVGRTVALDTARYLVVGVMPAAFRYPLGGVSLWVPLPPRTAADTAAGADPTQAIGRLAPGVTIAAGQA